jgi:hypothetical protein
MASRTSQLNIDHVSWMNLLTHPSEFVRLDELLRWKQLELKEFNERTRGWNKVAAQEILNHQRMLYSMRCYLVINGCHIFNTSVMSTNEYANLKNSFKEKENLISPTENNCASLTSPTQDEFWLILSTTNDRKNTETFYKKIIQNILCGMGGNVELYKMIDVIVNKCSFTV